jgi:hypothetical protein
VNEVILTVPPQFERDSVVDLMEIITSLRTPARVNDGTTVNYAMSRTFSTTSRVSRHLRRRRVSNTCHRRFVLCGRGSQDEVSVSYARLITFCTLDMCRCNGADLRMRDILIQFHLRTLLSSAARCRFDCGTHGCQVESVAFDIDFKAKLLTHNLRTLVKASTLDLQGPSTMHLNF